MFFRCVRGGEKQDSEKSRRGGLGCIGRKDKRRLSSDSPVLQKPKGRRFPSKGMHARLHTPRQKIKGVTKGIRQFKEKNEEGKKAERERKVCVDHKPQGRGRFLRKRGRLTEKES